MCQFQCLDQSLQLWVNLGNEGASALTAGATISIYGVKADVEPLITELPFIDMPHRSSVATQVTEYGLVHRVIERVDEV